MKKYKKNDFTTTFENDIELKKSYLPVLYKRGEYKDLFQLHTYYSQNLQDCITKLQSIKNYEEYFNCEELTLQDYIVAILIGFCGSMITTNEHLQEFLKLFHDRPEPGEEVSEFQIKMRKKLEHEGSYMDHGLGNTSGFVNREGGKPMFGMHRLMYGHDILSWKGDNPFVLAVKQYGFLGGIKNAIIHLFADTCSTQGVTIPLSSVFDFKDGETLSNRLYNFSSFVAKGDRGKKCLEAFKNLFTIHQTDILGSGATILLQETYLKICGFETKKAKNIFRVIVNICNFIITGIIGFIKTRIPRINWVSLYNMIIPCFSLVGGKLKEAKIKKIESKYTVNSQQITKNKERIYKIYRINYLLYSCTFLCLIVFLFYHLSSNQNVNNISSNKTQVTNNIKYGHSNKIPRELLDSITSKLEDTDVCIEYDSESRCLNYYVKNLGKKNDFEELRYKALFYLFLFNNSATKAAYDGSIKYSLIQSDSGYIIQSKIDNDSFIDFSKTINKESLEKNIAYSVAYPVHVNFGDDNFILENDIVKLDPEKYIVDLNGEINTSLDTYKKKYERLNYYWGNKIWDSYQELTDKDCIKKSVEEKVVYWGQNGNSDNSELFNYGYYVVDLSLFAQDYLAPNLAKHIYYDKQLSDDSKPKYEHRMTLIESYLKSVLE